MSRTHGLTLYIYCTSASALREYLDIAQTDAIARGTCTVSASPRMEEYGWILVGTVRGTAKFLPGDEVSKRGVQSCNNEIRNIFAKAEESANNLCNLRDSFLQIGYAGDASESSAADASNGA